MKSFLYKLLSSLFALFPMRRKVMFMSYYGSQYGSNPKYLSQHWLSACPDWEVVWVLAQPGKYAIQGVSRVRYLSVRFFYDLMTSRVLVTDYRMPLFYHKPKGQIYVQTWHSMLRLKTIEADAEAVLPPSYVKMARHDSAQTDLLLSGCRMSTEIFKRAYWYDGRIAETGTPRTDLLVASDSGVPQRVRASLGIAPDVRLLLYAPTFRQNADLSVLELDYDRVLRAAEQRWGGRWCLLLRLHPHQQHLSKAALSHCASAVDVSGYDDIQELLCTADLLITDYSALMFDFLLTRRPCLLYWRDYADYVERERTLYFAPGQLPFPIGYSQEELCEQIVAFDEQHYQERTGQFVSQHGLHPDGQACENALNEIFQLLYERN